MLIKSLRWVDIVEDSVQEIKEQRKMNFDSMINKASNNIFREIAEMKAEESNQIHNFPESESTIMSKQKARDKEVWKELVHVMDQNWWRRETKQPEGPQVNMETVSVS